MRINGIFRSNHQALETSENKPEVASQSATMVPLSGNSYSFARPDAESGAVSFAQASFAAFDLQALAQLGVRAGKASAAEAKALQRYEIALCNAQTEYHDSAPDSLRNTQNVRRCASDYQDARNNSDVIARQVADIVRGTRRSSESD